MGGEVQAQTIPSSNVNMMDTVGLKFPALAQFVVETPLDGFDMRKLLQYYPSFNNNRVAIPIEDMSNTATVDRVGEGEEAHMLVGPMKGKQCSTYKIGRGVRITSEMTRYQQFAMVAQRIRRLAFLMKNTVNVDIITALVAGVPAANIIPVTGQSLGKDGTVINRPATIGQYDITNGLQILQEAYKDTGTGKVMFMVNPAGHTPVTQLPMYSSKDMYGPEGYRLGLRGLIEGCQVGLSNNVPANVALLVATDPNSQYTGQRIPIGFFVESRPLTTVNKIREERDSYDVYAWWEYAPCVTYGKGIVKFTYGAVSS